MCELLNGNSRRESQHKSAIRWKMMSETEQDYDEKWAADPSNIHAKVELNALFDVARGGPKPPNACAHNPSGRPRVGMLT